MTKHQTAWTCLAAFVACVAFAASSEDVATAAKAHYPDAEWQARSLITADFTCQGREEFAILGTSTKYIVVAIFARGLDAKPEILEYSAQVRVAKWATLSEESRDFNPEQLDNQLGYLPEGLTPSKTCVGLNLSDGEIDSAHIYWDTKNKRFTDWVL